jgi:hypothetical protein
MDVQASSSDNKKAQTAQTPESPFVLFCAFGG